ncbi:MAG: hypothetical protein GX208_00505 [Firmicutes bacterium]|nr:hypothetical protein [Bacillota bacterium]
MGLRHAREYADIIADFTEAILAVPEFYSFLGISDLEWQTFDQAEQHNIAQTLADDLFYGLDEVPCLEVGQGLVEYIANDHIIKVSQNNIIIKIVNLV